MWMAVAPLQGSLLSQMPRHPGWSAAIRLSVSTGSDPWSATSKKQNHMVYNAALHMLTMYCYCIMTQMFSQDIWQTVMKVSPWMWLVWVWPVPLATCKRSLCCSEFSPSQFARLKLFVWLSINSAAAIKTDLINIPNLANFRFQIDLNYVNRLKKTFVRDTCTCLWWTSCLRILREYSRSKLLLLPLADLLGFWDCRLLFIKLHWFPGVIEKRIKHVY